MLTARALACQGSRHGYAAAVHELAICSAIAEIVERNARRHGVRYSAHRTLRSALRSHYRHLRAMGRLGLPVEVEMG